jgi:hypothetical protein
MPRKARRSPPQIECTAYHEAAHAVASIELNVRVRRLTIVPEGDNLGSCGYYMPPVWLDPDADLSPRAERWIQNRIIIILAGPAAEARFRGRKNHVGASGDYQLACDLACCVAGGGEVLDKYLAWLNAVAVNLVTWPGQWEAVKDLAALLLERQTLTGREAMDSWRRTTDRLIAGLRGLA